MHLRLCAEIVASRCAFGDAGFPGRGKTRRSVIL